MRRPPLPVVYDAGALLAAERGVDRFRVLHMRFLAAGLIPVVPSPVLTQAWRGGARQANLARAIAGCHIEPTDEETAKAAGVLLGRSGTADAVDAIVVVTALSRGSVVVTSDPGDLHKLAEAGDVASQLHLIVI
ncbi:PIN domain-containing protein [Fodinicola feengrottensis]|uniref:PIN domain-containing protein n=1 Tax=Fodinicola feengrottensis TaxID=435914 RepID=UPI0013D543E5